MACATCYKDWISCGVDAIIVQGSLLPLTPYTWIITTSQGAKYLGATTTDTNGFFVIPTSEFTSGFFNPYAGLFTLEAQTGNCTPASWNNSVYCDPYTCIEFEVKNGTGDKNTIGCPCLATVEGCCAPFVQEFINLATLNIPYTTQMAAKYGSVPTVQVWIYDLLGRLIYSPGITASFNAAPPTTISFNFGGLATGIIVIK